MTVPKCKICSHPDRLEIERALARGETYRAIAQGREFSYNAVTRHIPHVAAELQELREAGKIERARVINDEMEVCFAAARATLAACDAWLRDAEDPTKYNVGPRAEDILITYTEKVDEKTYQKKAPLSELLDIIEGSGRTVIFSQAFMADPRKLVLDAVKELRGLIDTLAKLTGAYVKKAPHPDEIEQKRRQYRTLLEDALQLEAVRKAGWSREEVIVYLIRRAGKEEMLDHIEITPAERAKVQSELKRLGGPEGVPEQYLLGG